MAIRGNRKEEKNYMTASKLESVLQAAFDQQEWLAQNMKTKSKTESDHNKKQKYLKASFAALGGSLAIKQLASKLEIKIKE